VMRRAVLPQIGDRDIAALTHEPVQVALIHMADMPLLIGSRNSSRESATASRRLRRRGRITQALSKSKDDTRKPARGCARSRCRVLPRTKKNQM
jgi:hypothetical protein